MRVDVGIDLVRVSRIAESIELFGDRFLAKIFTADELAYAQSSPSQTAERLAARFAAKEATKKALQLEGVSFRDIEVKRRPTGACDLVLHGQAAVADEGSLAVSLSHEGDYATAVVTRLAV